MFAVPPAPPAVADLVCAPQAAAGDLRDLRGARWTADRLADLPVPAEAACDCREALVRQCRDCPDFRAAVGELVRSGPDRIAELAGRLHDRRFDQLLSDVLRMARACGTPFAEGLADYESAGDEEADNPLAPLVKRLSKRAKLRDAGGVTLPLIVGRGLAEWAKISDRT